MSDVHATDREATLSSGRTQDPSNLETSILDQLNDGVYLVDRDRKITYWNRGAERISGFSAAEVIGSRCSDSLLIHVDEEGASLCHGACPLAYSMNDGQTRETNVYLHHKDGHRVPVNIRTSPLRDARGEVLGGLEVFAPTGDSDRLEEELESMRRLALFDPLTEIPNRRYAEMTLRARQDEFSRYDWPYGVLLLDVDHFKRFNDEHGHSTGDAVLRMVAQTLSVNLRSFDQVGRWGGEEFLVVSARTDRDMLHRLAERLRHLIEASGLSVEERLLSVTVSIGAASIRLGESSQSLVDRADACLYRAKRNGRNRAVTDESL